MLLICIGYHISFLLHPNTYDIPKTKKQKRYRKPKNKNIKKTSKQKANKLNKTQKHEKEKKRPIGHIAYQKNILDFFFQKPEKLTLL